MTDTPDKCDDVEGFGVVSLPLPETHWIYEPTGDPPAPLPLPAGLDRGRIKEAIWAAGKYAVRGATMSGRSPDFDPDAIVQTLVVRLLGDARPEAQLLGAEEPEPVPESVAMASYSPKSGGGYPDPEKPKMGLEQGERSEEKGKKP